MINGILTLVCLGLSVSYVWSYSKIFKPVREFISKIPYIRVPLLCPDCSSFWFGLSVSFLYNPILLDVYIPFLSNLFCGLIVHLFASFLYKIKNAIELVGIKSSPSSTSSIDFIN
jgi:hypothetical protein